MATELNQIELDITKEIINIGISKAADSFSFFIKGKVMIRLMDIQVNFDNYFPLSRKYPMNQNYLLTTIIKGELKGQAYLLFTEEEASKIVDANMPESIRNDPEAKTQMTVGFLLEIDNIITASVVTQFSNIFQRKMYGDVPSLNILPGNDINRYLSENQDKDLNVIYFNARFITETIEINPEFIWLMDDSFFEEVKRVVSDEKKLELLQKLNNTN
jgi:chemotaxis protein CheY-P-specific phosphatase CheC